MSKMQRTKGANGEREIVNTLKEAGVPAVRISMLETGNVRKGDVELEVAGVWKGSVKLGQHVPKFVYDARGNGEDFLFMRRDRSKWQVCMDLEFFLRYFI